METLVQQPPQQRAGTWLERLVLVRAGEGGPLLWSAALYFFVLASYYVLRPLRDAIGIKGELSDLPRLWTGTTAAMLLATPIVGWAVSRVARRIYVPGAYLVFFACVAGFYGAFALAPGGGGDLVRYAFFIWASVFNLLAVSIMWGVLVDRFSPEQGRRLFGAISVGGTLGAVAGAGMAAQLGAWLGARHLPAHHVLGISAVLLLAAAACGARLAAGMGRTPQARTGPMGAAFNGIALVARSPYLILLCVYMLLYTATQTFLYFEQARIVKSAISGDAERTAYFARIDLYVNILTLATQTLVTGRFVRAVGIGAALAVVPIITAGAFGVLAGWATLTTLMIVQVARRGLHYAVDRPCREVLYTVLGSEEKYKSKAFIDTFVYRGGDLLAAWSQSLKSVAGVIAPLGSGLALLWLLVGLVLGAMQARRAR